MTETAQTSPYFVALIAHSIPVEIQRLQCIISKQALANNTYWRLACVVDRSFSGYRQAIRNGKTKRLI
jgi:hypothetical protein